MNEDLKKSKKQISSCGACKGCKLKTILSKIETPLEKGLVIATGFALGIAVGMIISPITDGINIGSKNGCNNSTVARKK